MKNKKLHSFGDSHADFCFRGILPNEYRHNVGAITMKSTGFEHNILSIKIWFNRLVIDTEDTIIFCVGEVDCRTLFLKTQEKAVELITKYINTLLELKQDYPNIIVMSIMPPCYVTTFKNDSEVPFVGTNQERSLFTLRMNRMLEEICKVKKITYLNIYDDYKDDNGMLPPEYSYTKEKNDVHLGNTTFVKQKIIK